MRAAATIATLGALLAAPAIAWADESMSAGPPNRYSQSEVTIDQGEKVTFTNYDTVDHDVVARQNGPDGKPLFKSALVSRGASSPVAGTEYLTTGSYDFFCSLHPQMTGKMNVTSAGTPVPRPSQPQPEPQPTPPPSGEGDKAPSATVRLLDSRLRTVRRRRALRVRLSSDEPASFHVIVRLGRRTLAKRTYRVTRAGTRTVRVRLSRTAVRRLRRSRARIAISAHVTDGGGNAVTARTARTLRR
jgi:plastocyanin